jgi:hypothetical protein
MSKPHKSSNPKQLLVEGKNDQHVIWALCKQYDLPKDFSVELPNTEETDGIEALLDGLPAKLKERGLETLGIVVDADLDLAARWQSVTQKLKDSGYQNLPGLTQGFIVILSETQCSVRGAFALANRISEILHFAIAPFRMTGSGWFCVSPVFLNCRLLKVGFMSNQSYPK